jgi:hypothetical protein
MKYSNFNKIYIHVRLISTKIRPMKYIYSDPFFYNEDNLKNAISILDVNKKYSLLFHLHTQDHL